MSIPLQSHTIDIYDADVISGLVHHVQRDPDRYTPDFYRAFWSDAYRLAYGIAGNALDAEDIAQTALTRALTSLDTLDNPKAVLKWVRRIVSNAALNHTRDERRRMAGFTNIDADISEYEAFTESAQIEQTDIHHLPGELIERKEVQQIVLELIKELAPRQREAIMMYYYAGMTVPQMAVDLEMNENAVGSLLFRARDTLNARIQEIERAQDIRLYGVEVLPLGPLLHIASDSLIVAPEVPLFESVVALDRGEAKQSERSEQLSNSNRITLKQGFTIGAAVALTLATGWFLLDRDSAAESEPPTVSTLTTTETGDETKPQETDESPRTTGARGSDVPSPVAPSPPSTTGPDNDDRIIFFPENQSPAAPPSDITDDWLVLPDIDSLIYFGSIDGTPLSWRVTDRTATTMTMRAIEEVPTLQGAFTSAEQQAILAKSGGSRPTLELDGEKLDFVFIGNLLYALVR